MDASLSTGSGYNSKMTRVGVCSGQSSGRLWGSICHNLMITGSWRLTMGPSMGRWTSKYGKGPGKHDQQAIPGLMIGVAEAISLEGMTMLVAEVD
uniref:Uncharacterized protein n=1 Tax=Romanomermis culicivorax TaxID=13658 RepID=A0A915IP80_ROMCU